MGKLGSVQAKAYCDFYFLFQLGESSFFFLFLIEGSKSEDA
jgi:hypothetical protein